MYIDNQTLEKIYNTVADLYTDCTIPDTESAEEAKDKLEI